MLAGTARRRIALADWGRATALRAPATAPRSATSSMTPCAAAGRWPPRWATIPPGDRPGCGPAGARSAGQRPDASADGSAVCGGAAERSRTGRPGARGAGRRAGPLAATSRIGSSPRWRAPSARPRPRKARRWRGGRRWTCGSIRSRPTATRCSRRWPDSPRRRPVIAVGVRLPAPEARAGTPTSKPKSAMARGWYEVQDEGSQLAALMATRRPAPAGARYLCRRRRQDAGLRRRHAQHRSSLRLRRGCGCACARSSSG